MTCHGGALMAGAAAVFLCAGCSTGQQETGRRAITDLSLPRLCGVTAATLTRQPERYQEMPPACALPTVEQVARSCAVQDRVSTPGYIEPDCDSATGICTPPEQPLPAYRVTELQCRYSNGDESAALCRFHLSIPGDAGEGSVVEMPFDHRFWADHGPTHHIYGTLWMLAPGADCTPEGAMPT